jgi:phospholipase A-2-activating protein
MYPDEVNLIDEAFTYLTHALAVPPIPPTVTLTAGHIEAIVSILDRWPLSQRFPGT